MKNNNKLITLLRDFVKTLYKEGYDEIFCFSIFGDLSRAEKGIERVGIEVAQFDLDYKQLDAKVYNHAAEKAVESLKEAKNLYGKGCNSILALINSEVPEEFDFAKGVLRVFNLNAVLPEEVK